MVPNSSSQRNRLECFQDLVLPIEPCDAHLNLAAPERPKLQSRHGGVLEQETDLYVCQDELLVAADVAIMLLALFLSKILATLLDATVDTHLAIGHNPSDQISPLVASNKETIGSP